MRKILLSSVLLAAENPGNRDNQFFVIMDVLFIAVFTLEAAVRIIVRDRVRQFCP